MSGLRRFLLAFALIGSAVAAEEIPVDDADRVRQGLQSSVNTWRNLCTHIVVVEFRDANPTGNIVAEHHLVTTVSGNFREHVLRRPEVVRLTPADNDQDIRVQQRVWNGITLTTVKPGETVEHYLNVVPEPPLHEPFSVLLASMEFDGSLADLMHVGESLYEVSVEFVRTSGGDDTSPIVIRRTSGLPGRSTQTQTELTVLRSEVDGTVSWQPLSGTVSRIDADGKASMVCVARIVNRGHHSPTLNYEVRASFTGDPNKSAVERRLQVFSEPLPESLPETFFLQDEYRGDPVIHTFRDGVRLSKANYFPPADVPEVERWSVFEKWLLVNDVVIGSLVVAYLLRLSFTRRNTAPPVDS